MAIQENVSLGGYSTMRLGGAARYLSDVKKPEEVSQLADWARTNNIPIIMIGRGSNIVWRDEGFSGLILVNKIGGREVMSDDSHSTTIKFGGGENWDDSVKWSVDKKLTGLEYMSLIPGTVGAAPVQNVGAYGGELSQTLLEVEAYDTAINSFVRLQNHECGFSYRSSRFKTADKHRFLILSVTVTLRKTSPVPPFYESLQRYLDENGIEKFTPKTIREAVIAIRQSKLPDPEKVANNGSFFTNPIVDETKFNELKSRYPDIKGWPAAGGPH
jgi:UDP-N-acetylmuramate dehydrogenase